MNPLETVAVAMLAGSLRVSTPFLFVSLGECLTERSGRINLGNEGVLVLGAMSAYATAYLTGSPYIGVVVGALIGALLGGIHGIICALTVSPLFILGVIAAFVMAWFFRATRLGLRLRIVGDSADAARALGLNINRTRLLATMAGSALAGIGGAFLSLVYPGSWNESLSSGQGLMAVALVVFARWSPVGCLGAAMLFGAAGALGPSLQTVGVTSYYYLFYAAPFVLTLAILIATVRPGRTVRGMPGELSIAR
jgi:ABC-type uncharacterized transport system permease subunit